MKKMKIKKNRNNLRINDLYYFCPINKLLQSNIIKEIINISLFIILANFLFKN